MSYQPYLEAVIGGESAKRWLLEANKVCFYISTIESLFQRMKFLKSFLFL
jgi:hypothetical protein